MHKLWLDIEELRNISLHSTFFDDHIDDLLQSIGGEVTLAQLTPLCKIYPMFEAKLEVLLLRFASRELGTSVKLRQLAFLLWCFALLLRLSSLHCISLGLELLPELSSQPCVLKQPFLRKLVRLNEERLRFLFEVFWIIDEAASSMAGLFANRLQILIKA